MPLNSLVVDSFAEIREVSHVIPEPPVEVILTPREQLLEKSDIPVSDYFYASDIISKESGWDHTIWNTAGSSAYGLCQSLPAGKMISAGEDYMTNPLT